MENMSNVNDYEAITSQETYEPVIGQLEPTFYPAPASWLEVLGIFPTEFRGATYYQPLFYYVPVYDNFNCLLTPDLVQQEYETNSIEYCSSDSETELSSSSSDIYYTAEETESFFDPEECNCKDEEFGYLSENGLEKKSVEYSTNDRFESSKDKQSLIPSESFKSNFEEEDHDATLLKNVNEIKSDYLPNYESNRDNGYYGSENASSVCDDTYEDVISQSDNSFETEESQFLGIYNTESNGEIESFHSVNSARSCDANGIGDMVLPEIPTFDNSVKDSSAGNVKNDKVDKHRPFTNSGISERVDFTQKYSLNAFEFGDINNKDRHNQGLKKCNTFENLSNLEPKQYMKKMNNLENLSRFDENDIYEKDSQCENSEETDNYEFDMKNLPFDPDEFDFTKEEVKYFKDNIYRRALSGKLYQKRYIPSVAVLPTIYEVDESFRETNEEAVSHTSCLTEQQGHFNCSLCNLFDPSEENGEAEQKPKKKRMKRIREFLAKMFCCVKPP